MARGVGECMSDPWKPDLLPCPFCGAQAHAAPSGASGAVIGCGECSARTVSDFGAREAAAEWNRRADVRARAEMDEIWELMKMAERIAQIYGLGFGDLQPLVWPKHEQHEFAEAMSSGRWRAAMQWLKAAAVAQGGKPGGTEPSEQTLDFLSRHLVTGPNGKFITLPADTWRMMWRLVRMVDTLPPLPADAIG